MHTCARTRERGEGQKKRETENLKQPNVELHPRPLRYDLNRNQESATQTPEPPRSPCTSWSSDWTQRIPGRSPRPREMTESLDEEGWVPERLCGGDSFTFQTHFHLISLPTLFRLWAEWKINLCWVQPLRFGAITYRKPTYLMQTDHQWCYLVIILANNHCVENSWLWK